MTESRFKNRINFMGRSPIPMTVIPATLAYKVSFTSQESSVKPESESESESNTVTTVTTEGKRSFRLGD